MTKNIMRKISPKSSDTDSFKNSILILLHYYDISFHPEILSYLKPYKNRFDFIHITPAEFETNNPNISLNVFNENQEQIYISNNNKAPYQAYIVQLKIIDMQQ